MTRTEYMEEMKENIINYIKENEIRFENFEDREEFERYLNDELWIADSVTGNASGSYTFNTWQAEENIAHAWDVLEEALAEFGTEENPIEKGAEWCDVTIRCYLLPEAIASVLDEMEINRRWEIIASYMDDEIREDLHHDLAPCSNMTFLKAYIERDPSFTTLLSNEFDIAI